MCYTINIIATAYQIFSVFQMIATGGCTGLKDEAEKGNSSQIFCWVEYIVSESAPTLILSEDSAIRCMFSLF